MLILPAVDLLGGEAVRLTKGNYDDSKTYFKNPLDAAKAFADMGLERLHVVDLDGAKTGDTVNFSVIESMVRSVNMAIEVGGGIRDMARLERYFAIGVRYAILGTVTVKNPDFVKEALAAYPGRVVLGVDAKGGMVATEGWLETSSLSAIDVVNRYKDLSAESVIYTDIEKDGMLGGVNLAQTDALAKASPFPVIASGGVASVKDISDLTALNNPNIKGCIVGKAYYEGKIDLKEAARIARGD